MSYCKARGWRAHSMDKKIIVESLVLDMKRVSIGLQRGSLAMADRFKQEALKRLEELRNYKQDNYLNKLLINSQKVLEKTEERTAEDSLMYSILLQNYALKIIKR